MNEKSLGKNLSNLERELVNLQTAHDIPLGAVDYYEYRVSFRMTHYEGAYRIAYLLVGIKDGELPFPYLEKWGVSQINVNNYVLDFGFINNDSGTRFVVIFLALGNDDYDVTQIITSTSQLVTRVTYSQSEAEEWLEG